MNIGVWILSLVQPLMSRILVALGFSVVSIVGLDAIFTQLKAQLSADFAALPADMLNRPLKNAPLMPAWTPLAFFFVNPTMQSDFNLGLHGLPDPFRG